MNFRPSSAAFAVIYSVAYTVALAMNWPLFNYYPLSGQFSLGPHQIVDAGPPIVWYGLIATALLVAIALSTFVPSSWFVNRFRNTLWLFPAIAMLACAVLMRGFFQ